MLSLEKKRFKDYTITIFTYMMDFPCSIEIRTSALRKLQED